MPGTLNGKTGLRAMLVELEKMERFDPFAEAVAFEGLQRIHVADSPEVRIMDQHFGPYANETVEVPLSVAVLLIAKGVALPVR
jgi:hypothetical protein